MNISSSECSSGCESGWTMYLDQSANSADQFQKAGGRIVGEDCRYNRAAAAINVEDHEDLSMVSDASSGPPHNFLEDDDQEGCFDGTENFLYGSASHEQANKSKNKEKIREQRGKQLHSYLDDTASSPRKKHTVLPPSGTPMENTLGFSQGSSKHFKPHGKSTMRKQLGFFRSSMSGNPASGPAGGLQGRKWE